MQSEKKNSSKILFHYTSVGTLLKILDCNDKDKICFWATHAKFFNDPHEYKLAVSFLKQSMEKFEKANNVIDRKSINFNKNKLTKLGVVFGEPFMFSLSGKPNDLTMWRTYGANGKGVAIGLDWNMLDEYAKKSDNTNLLQCQYNKDLILNKLTKDWEQQYDKVSFIDGGKRIATSSLSFIFNLITFSFSFKRSEYNLEEEWRLCKNEFNEAKVKFREKDGLLIPFIEHYFDKEIIKKIIIGPCVNKELTKDSIKMLLKSRKYNLPQESIITSKIPYRQI